MTQRFACGLVVGKFSPLHKGHEFLIRRAIEACEKVIVLSYTRPELPLCGSANRRRWLEALFPETIRIVLEPDGVPGTDADEEVQREFVAKLLRERGHCVDAVFTSETYGDGFARSLEWRQQAWNPRSGTVAHVCVDPDRSAVPVSGTLLREGRVARGAFLSPVVRRDMVLRICLLGGESTGKTTLARALAEATGEPWVAEYGRELWEVQGGKLEFEDLRRIAEEQIRREEAAVLEAGRHVFCDTSPLTTLFYCHDMFGRADPALEAMALRRYDVTLLCGDDFEFFQDGTRRGAGFRERGQAWYRQALGSRGTEWIDVRGSLQARIDQVQGLLGKLAPQAFGPAFRGKP
jgi:HTH-type transcriptional regulator, transcriptional repressor of NAD biosynthesis genes